MPYQQLTRRSMLRLGALGFAQLQLTGCLLASDSGQTVPDNHLVDHAVDASAKCGIQLYTVREQLAENAADTLEALAKIGFEEVELAGLPEGISGADFKTMLDEAGLVCPAMHLQGDVASQAAIAETVGASLIVMPVSMEMLDKDWQPRKDLSLDDFRRIAASLNDTGAACKKLGFDFGYHNHAWEMALIDGELPYEILLSETDPELVFMELDLGWAHVGKVNVIDLFERHAKRFRTCHVKDFTAEDEMVNPGEGQVDLKRYISLHEQAGFEHYFIEHDNSKSPLETARVGHQYLQSIGFRAGA